jgi:hypothetical protein
MPVSRKELAGPAIICVLSWLDGTRLLFSVVKWITLLLFCYFLGSMVPGYCFR